MTQRKLTSILVFLGLMLLFTIQLPAQNSRQSSSQTPEKKQMTRAQFAELGEQKQRKLVHDFDLIEITDVVNATQEEAMNNKDANVSYCSLADFNSASKEKKFNLVSNPDKYKVYEPGTVSKGVVNGVVKTKTITISELKSLPESKQHDIISSGEFTIIE